MLWGSEGLLDWVEAGGASEGCWSEMERVGSAGVASGSSMPGGDEFIRDGLFGRCSAGAAGCSGVAGW